MLRWMPVCIYAVILVSCGGAGKTEPAKTPVPPGPAKANVIDTVIGAYMRLKDAFITREINKVSEAATALQASCSLPDSSTLAGIPMKSPAMFITICRQVGNQAAALAAASSMAARLEYFKGLIEPMRKIAATHTSRVLYVQYCAGAFNNKGAHWLSYSSDIRNPYTPAATPACGLVQDTLK